MTSASSCGTVAVILWAFAFPTLGSGQDTTSAGREVARLASSGWVTVKSSKVPPLQRTLSVDLEHVSVRRAIQEIARRGNLPIGYGDDVLQSRVQVSLRARGLTVAEALTATLQGTGLEAYVSLISGAVVVRRAPPRIAPGPTGLIIGRVIDAKTEAPLVGAMVFVVGTNGSATTGNDGRYRITDVAPGTYSARARYIGYSPASASVTVEADRQTTADFGLEKSAQPLEEVVTTGTLVPTEVKALPTPVTVVGQNEITQQRPHDLQDLFRQAVPTAVSFDYPQDPSRTVFSVRGASTLSSGSGQMKVILDGIEAADPSQAAVDPASVERVEVIRGPQAAAVYGADAIGGVIQVFTKRGDESGHPHVDASAALGVLQTPYVGFSGVLRQTYTASVRGGAPAVSYNLGAGYSRTSDFLPTGDQSSVSNPSVYGGVHVARGILTVDLAGRYYVTKDQPFAFNPDISQTGLSYYSKPFYSPGEAQNQTVSAQLGVTPTGWWHNTITVGIDRFVDDYAQQRPRLTTPDDTLLQVFNLSYVKTAVSYHTSVEGNLGLNLSGSLAAGIDHFSLPETSLNALGYNTTGDIQTAPDGFISASRTVTTSTGYFVQAQLGFHDVLFVTGALRAERNSEFGDSLGTPISPRVGLSFVQPVGEATLKLRGSWGRAIRAPFAGQKSRVATPFSVTLANPLLGPERQHGWDAGADLAFGARGSLGVTYYDQTADNLIQSVTLPNDTILTDQWQNVGQVRNTGVELEGGLDLGLVQLRAQYGYARARIDQLAPGYTGNLRVGDQTLITPKHTAGASLAVTPRRGTSVSAGLTYVGSWNNYDYLAELRCFGGTGPCPPTSRDYIVAYPSLLKVKASLSQELTPFLSTFLSVDNLTNNQSHEGDNLEPVMGRITTVGIKFHN